MKKTNFFLLSLLLITFITKAVLAAGEMSSVDYGNSSSFTNAQGTSTSPKYKNVLDLGLLSADTTSFHYRNNAGFYASQSFTAIPDNNISFYNETPSASAWQLTTSVTAQITVQMNGGNTIDHVQYRISNTGPTLTNFFGWQNDYSTTSVIGSISTFSVKIPNSAGQTFLEGQNNYIQWLVVNDAGAQALSGVYQISVRVNDAPAIVITQPDVKSQFTSLTPDIAATVTVQFGAVDPGSLKIMIDNANGSNLATIASSAITYNASTGILSYKYAGPALTANATYKLTVSASDTLGKASSVSMNFIPKSGAIADLVPYPSPFNPKVQPVVIRYVLEKRADVWINIYDMSRRIVKRVVEAQPRGPGLCEDQWYGVNFGGQQLANGVYFCEVIAKNGDGEARRYTALAILGK